MESLQISNLFPIPGTIEYFIFVFHVNADNNFACGDSKLETMHRVSGRCRHLKPFTDITIAKTVRRLLGNSILMFPQSYFENTFGTISQPTEINLVTGFVLRYSITTIKRYAVKQNVTEITILANIFIA